MLSLYLALDKTVCLTIDSKMKYKDSKCHLMCNTFSLVIMSHICFVFTLKSDHLQTMLLSTTGLLVFIFLCKVDKLITSSVLHHRCEVEMKCNLG